jgi:UDP-2,4-diacetamido-2,4,6-trideoxy-beta-L-altropyranose hydrolase
MDPRHRSLRLLFRVSAGPRVGFGHLVRVSSLATALGVPLVLSIRGAHASVLQTARSLGGKVIGGDSARTVLARVRPEILVLDDRVARQTAAWRREARRLGVPIVSVHDLGIGLGDADLVVDGSIAAVHRPSGGRLLLGPRFAILNPRTLSARSRRKRARRRLDVVVALGGGPRRSIALALARALVDCRPGLRVGVAIGFVARAVAGAATDVEWVRPDGFGAALSSARVAVVGGGLTVYESLALGVPSVGVSVVPSQRPTVTGLARRGALVDGGAIGGRPRRPGAVARLARAVCGLLDDTTRQRTLRRAAAVLVDDRGAARVAKAIVQLARAGCAGQVGKS